MQLSAAEKKFIEVNKNKPLAEIALRLSGNEELNRDFILQQINGLQKIGSKIPSWKNTYRYISIHCFSLG